MSTVSKSATFRVGVDAREICDRPAGKGQYLIRLLTEWLQTKPFSLTLYIADGQEVPSTIVGADVVAVKARGLLWHRAVGRRLGTDGVEVFFASQSYLSALFNRVPTVTVVHDLAIFQKAQYSNNRKAQLVERLTMKRAVRASAKVIAVSEATKRDIVLFGNAQPESITVIYEAAMLNAKASTPLPPDKRKNYFLFVGTLEPRKNIGSLLRAFAQLSPALREKYSLKLVGKVGWGGEDYVALAQELGIEKKVAFLGYQPDSEVQKLFSEATVFVYPSWYEGFGLPVIEAMSVGTPVVTSNTSSLPEVVGDTGLLCDPSDPEAMAAAITRYCTDAKFYRQESAAAFARAQLFNWSDIAAKTAKILKEARG